MYRGPCILRPPSQPEKYGLKLKVILKWRGGYIEYKSCVTDGKLYIEGIVTWRGS